MENSKIEWTDHTWNPWMGCTKVSPGCKHCYAETLMDTRYGKVEWGPQGKRIRTSDANWRKPLAWNRAAEFAGQRARVFCASLADIFEDKADQRLEMDLWRDDLWRLIKATPWLEWLILTKRPENICKMVPWEWVEHMKRWPANVWLGVSVENQEQADKRIPALLKIPAAVRFLSCEPLLGPVSLADENSSWRTCTVPHGDDDGGPYYLNDADYHGIDWVIVGGESGPNARPMNPDWARSLRDQCEAAGVPYFFKQHGEWTAEYPQGVSLANRKMTYQHGLTFYKLGKHLSGRLLDGREWNEFPGGPG